MHFFCIYIFNAIFAIFIDLNSQNWINILMFGLVVTCIETHILVTNFSISHIFLSIIKFFLLEITLRAALQFKYSML